MDNLVVVVPIAIALLVLGLVGGYIVQIWVARRQASAVALNLESELERVEVKQRDLIEDARKQAGQLREEVEREIREQRGEVRRHDRRLQKREESADRRAEAFDRREEELRKRESNIDRRRNQLEVAQKEHVEALERVSQMTCDDARDVLLGQIEDESAERFAQIIRESDTKAKAEANHRARWLVGMALQRVSADHSSVSTVSSIPLPSDDMKGRVIGREGRNIRALESATGVDLIIDDTPETVVISCFDPVRREVARTALTRLIEDGRIHPTRIEEHVAKARKEINAIIRAEGERAAMDIGVSKLHPEIIQLLGRLRYRQSYGQNVLSHSLEVAFLAASMAAEMGGDANLSRFGGLLHDCGKAIGHEVEGPHALIGAERCRRFGVPEAVAHIVEAHHFEVEPTTFEAFAVAAADAVSAARPGARRETVELFVRRLEELEGIANSFPGVEQSYAIQAGREVRIAVKPDELDELGALRLSRDVVSRIQETMTYPGQIKVTVIRETRTVGTAR